MAVAHSTSTKRENSSLKYRDFTIDFCHRLYEVAAIVDGARALAFEIDEGENVFVTLALDVVKEKLMALGTALDSTCLTYELKDCQAQLEGGVA
jgi:hypothetical protein